ncbi:MAG: hypothetical protein A2X11_06415 [Bacteroidetes bacterium GWE2_42_24]|nr:MAG: hypothetical protein A2X11_06415 [Bacteroidetes bacterium GWE2_42_24]OFY25701.1 MAG: hypothetical protein A2X09_01640 [Bacteroidetes bacterium GWF2_43_11]
MAGIALALGHEPTAGQQKALLMLGYLLHDDGRLKAMLLKGYAGTGKTTLLAAIVKSSALLGYQTVLMAPTGRAAKVLSAYTGQAAFTIHKKIYRSYTNVAGGVGFAMQPNLHQKTIFIVDEASMIQADDLYQPGSGVESRNLLADLLNYVSYGKHCRLIISGDTAQLPPVHAEQSPALDKSVIEQHLNWRMAEMELTDVVRQELDSGILYNATQLRNRVGEEQVSKPFFTTEGYKDVRQPDPSTFSDIFADAFTGSNLHESVVICRSNKRANMYNREIRGRILFRDDELNAGDLLMVVKNNYFWMPEDQPYGFIANGDIVEVKRILRITELYGFRFARAEVSFIDYEMPPIQVNLMLDTLNSESPALSQPDQKRLFDTILLDYTDIKGRQKQIDEVRRNEWFNALQVKYAYALTCHKTQGGQWKRVFIDAPYNPDNVFTTNDIRWFYTAITRASETVYLAGFDLSYFN